MAKFKAYSVTSISGIPSNQRDVNGVYFLRTADGFEIYRVNEVSKDWIKTNYTKLEKRQAFVNFPVTGDKDTLYIAESEPNIYYWDSANGQYYAGAGNMHTSVYDPTNQKADAFDYNNFHNTPPSLVAGAAIDIDGSDKINVKVDGTTLEIHSDQVRIKDSGVSNAKLADMNANTIKGRITSNGQPQDLSAPNVRTIINVEEGAQKNPATVTQAQAETEGNTTTYLWTPQRVWQAIRKWWTSIIDTNTSLGASDTKVPSQKAVKEYVDSQVTGTPDLQEVTDEGAITENLITLEKGWKSNYIQEWPRGVTNANDGIFIIINKPSGSHNNYKIDISISHSFTSAQIKAEDIHLSLYHYGRVLSGYGKFDVINDVKICNVTNSRKIGLFLKLGSITNSNTVNIKVAANNEKFEIEEVVGDTWANIQSNYALTNVEDIDINSIRKLKLEDFPTFLIENATDGLLIKSETLANTQTILEIILFKGNNWSGDQNLRESYRQFYIWGNAWSNTWGMFGDFEGLENKVKRIVDTRFSTILRNQFWVNPGAGYYVQVKQVSAGKNTEMIHEVSVEPKPSGPTVTEYDVLPIDRKVIEEDDSLDFPSTGNRATLYIENSTGKLFRWSSVLGDYDEILGGGGGGSFAFDIDSNLGTEFSIGDSEQLQFLDGNNVELIFDAPGKSITINAADTTYGVFNNSNNGLVPTTSGVASPATKYLRGDGTWAVPTNTVYTLPTASASVKGGVKVGNGLNITSEILTVEPNTTADTITVDASGVKVKPENIDFNELKDTNIPAAGSRVNGDIIYWNNGKWNLKPENSGGGGGGPYDFWNVGDGVNVLFAVQNSDPVDFIEGENVSISFDDYGAGGSIEFSAVDSRYNLSSGFGIWQKAPPQYDSSDDMWNFQVENRGLTDISQSILVGSTVTIPINDEITVYEVTINGSYNFEFDLTDIDELNPGAGASATFLNFTLKIVCYMESDKDFDSMFSNYDNLSVDADDWDQNAAKNIIYIDINKIDKTKTGNSGKNKIFGEVKVVPYD